jgi:hypothetical protein
MRKNYFNLSRLQFFLFSRTPGLGPAPLQEGVTSVRVSMLGPVLTAYMIVSFHHAHSLTQGLEGNRSKPRDVKPPKDAAR